MSDGLEECLEETLDVMVKRGFVTATLGDDGQVRYCITDIGKLELAFLKDD